MRKLQILRKEIPSTMVYEDEQAVSKQRTFKTRLSSRRAIVQAYAFRDINPAGPTHVLVIPKNKDGLSQLQKVEHPPTNDTVLPRRDVAPCFRCVRIRNTLSGTYCMSPS